MQKRQSEEHVHQNASRLQRAVFHEQAFTQADRSDGQHIACRRAGILRPITYKLEPLYIDVKLINYCLDASLEFHNGLSTVHNAVLIYRF
jgi:hypothetical protein